MKSEYKRDRNPLYCGMRFNAEISQNAKSSLDTSETGISSEKGDPWVGGKVFKFK